MKPKLLRRIHAISIVDHLKLAVEFAKIFVARLKRF